MNRIWKGTLRQAGAVAAVLVAVVLASLACGGGTPTPTPREEPDESSGSGEVESASGEAIVISDSAVVRSEPDVESDPVTMLSQGDVVELKAYMPQEQWYLIDLSGTGSAVSEGWIRASFLLVGVTLTPSDTPDTPDGPVDVPRPIETVTVTATAAATPPDDQTGSSGGEGLTGIVVQPQEPLTEALLTLASIPTATNTPPGAAATAIPSTP